MWWAGIEAGVLLLFIWAYVHVSEERRKIIGCQHKNTKVESLYDEGTYLYLQCQDCPLQIHLTDLVPLPPTDTFWWTRGREQYGEEHVAALKEIREMDEEDQAEAE